jgi:hypothetical protein
LLLFSHTPIPHIRSGAGLRPLEMDIERTSLQGQNEYHVCESAFSAYKSDSSEYEDMLVPVDLHSIRPRGTPCSQPFAPQACAHSAEPPPLD